MSLSLFAADALIRDYLNGRVLPSALHRVVVLEAEMRLLNGLMPVLDETLRSKIEGNATELTTWSAESVLEAVRERGRKLRAVSRIIGTLRPV